jgi:hypothetical protein
MRYAADLVQESENSRRAAAAVAWAVCADSRFTEPDERVTRFREKGWGGYAHFVKDAGVMTADDDGVAALQSGFLAMVEARSWLARVDGIERLSLTDSRAVQISALTAEVTAEGGLKPTTRLDLSVAGAVVKAAALLVMSAEFLRTADAESQLTIARLLAAATARAMDAELVTLLTAGAPNGSAAIGDLLDVIAGGSPAMPVLLAGYDVLLPLAPSLRDVRDLGVQIVPTAAARGKLILFDAAGVAIADSGAEVQTARDAMITLPGSPGENVSLFQRNLVAIRGERWFRMAATPTAVAWASTGSPA